MNFNNALIDISLAETSLKLVIALALSLVVNWTHKKFLKKSNYSILTSIELSVLSLVVTGLIVLIGTSIPVAIGIFGVISIVRFRTPIKETTDTMFLLWSILIGIGIGTNAIIPTLLITTFIAVVIYFFSKNKVSKKAGHLVKVVSSLDQEPKITATLNEQLDIKLKEIHSNVLNDTIFHFQVKPCKEEALKASLAKLQKDKDVKQVFVLI